MFRPDKPPVKALERLSENQLTTIYNKVSSLVVSETTYWINEEVQKQGLGKTFLDIQNNRDKDGKPKQRLVVTREALEQWSAQMAEKAHRDIKNGYYDVEDKEAAHELGRFYDEELSKNDKEQIFVAALKPQYGSLLELPEPYNQ